MNVLQLVAASLAPLFPVTVGVEWTYDLQSLSFKGTLVQRIEQSAPSGIGHELRISSKATLGGQVVYGEERILVSDTTIHKITGPMGAYMPSLCVFSSSGTRSWSWDGSVGEASAARAEVRRLSDARLTLPVGRYDAIVSEIGLQIGNIVTTSRYWLSRGVGWVRIEHDMPGGTLTAELLKFKPG